MRWFLTLLFLVAREEKLAHLEQMVSLATVAVVEMVNVVHKVLLVLPVQLAQSDLLARKEFKVYKVCLVKKEIKAILE
jgi:hypothetical protein